ncbi:MAG: M24 family metallopeptidase [Aggregatilineales bacterium]
MDYAGRIKEFQSKLAGVADLAFFPISADLQYLTGVPRDIPNYGRNIHPGEWLEGAWIPGEGDPVLALPRMTAEFGGLDRMTGIDLRVLGDHDAPTAMVRDILNGFNLPDNPRIAIADLTHGDSIVHLQAIVPDAKFVSGTELLSGMRAIKSEEEIATMRKAGEITVAAFEATLKNLKHGMLELDVVEEVNYQLRKHGSLGQSFTTSLYNSAPNHPLIFGDRMNTWKRVLKAPVAILFDFGAIYEGFCYDFGRTVHFGEPNDEMKKVHRLIMESQAAGIAALKAGTATCEEVDAAARNVLIEAGYGEEFRHRLGHGIGMDVHEPPFLTKGDTTPVQEGMMFTIEPSITQFDNFSARVEDVIVARPDGGEALTTVYPDLIVVE